MVAKDFQGESILWLLPIYHQAFQVPKITEPYKIIFGMGFPLHLPLHTAYIASILGENFGSSSITRFSPRRLM